MDKFNSIQKELVKVCEEAHYYGLRHKGISGTICEDELIHRLRDLLPEFNFNRGVIKFSDKQGDDLKTDDLSTQIDIIIYKGDPDYYSNGQMVIRASNIVGVIEVKKWLYPKKLKKEEKLTQNLLDLQRQFNERINRDVTIFIVTYRFHDRKIKKIDWFSERNILPFDSFCFFGTFTSANGKNNYPWEEGDRWEKFDDFMFNPYAGQLEKLIKSIAKIY